MPRYIFPVHSGVHRLACLSLYHALISQCAKSWLSTQKAGEIRNLINTRFRRDKSLQSAGKIEHSLKAGYEALDLLHSCAKGNTGSISRIDNLLADTQSLINKEHARRREQAAGRHLEDGEPSSEKRAESITSKKPRTDLPHPERKPILSRPFPHVSGIRRVPRFVNARGIPFLRIKKPQPRSLTRALRSKLAARWKRFERRDRLQQELLFAKDEDRWDNLIGMRDSVNWTAGIQLSFQNLFAAMDKGNLDNYKLAEKMWGVVLAEKELAEKEKEERKRLKATQKEADQRTAKDRDEPSIAS